MLKVLFSTSCSIKGNAYNVRICIDENSASDNILLTNDDFQLKSNPIDHLNYIRIEFELLNSEKIDSINKNDDTIPRAIILNKLLNIKRKELTQININYVEISELFLWTIKQIEVEIDSISGHQLYSILNENLLKLQDRPRSLLVFVNSQCGKGK
jgi:hypothetical protein